MGEFVTPREASKSLRVSTETLKNWEKGGKLTSKKTGGGHRRYKASDVNRLSGCGAAMYKVVEDNCITFYPKVLKEMQAEEVLLDFDLEYLSQWAEGSRRPEWVLCVSSDDNNYYKVFKYPQDIEVGFQVVQMKWGVKV